MSLRIYSLVVFTYAGSQFERALIVGKEKVLIFTTIPELFANLFIMLYGYDTKRQSIRHLSWNAKVNLFYQNKARWVAAKKPYLFTAAKYKNAKFLETSNKLIHYESINKLR